MCLAEQKTKQKTTDKFRARVELLILYRIQILSEGRATDTLQHPNVWWTQFFFPDVKPELWWMVSPALGRDGQKFRWRSESETSHSRMLRSWMSSYTVFHDFSCDVNKACRIRLEATVCRYFSQAQLLFCYVFHAKDERCEQVNVCVRAYPRRSLGLLSQSLSVLCWKDRDLVFHFNLWAW